MNNQGQNHLIIQRNNYCTICSHKNSYFTFLYCKSIEIDLEQWGQKPVSLPICLLIVQNYIESFGAACVQCMALSLNK